jgi:hypothetical protein
VHYGLEVDVMPVGQKFLSQLFVESNPSELCFHIVVLFLAFVSAIAHKKCAKIQKFSHICKKNLHFASEMERKTDRTPKKAAAHTKQAPQVPTLQTKKRDPKVSIFTEQPC